MTLLELLAELRDKQITLEPDPSARVKFATMHGTIPAPLVPHIRTYLQELHVPLAIGPDGEWPFGVRVQAGMTEPQVQTLLRQIRAEFVASPLQVMYWGVRQAAHGTFAIEVLHCPENCIEHAIDATHYRQLWDRCQGARLLLFSRHAWLTRPPSWRKLIPA